MIYLIVGILAFGLATGLGGRTTNQRGALETIARQPLGGVLLAIVAVALAGYALWRLSHALLGHGSEGSRDSTLDRIAALGSGVVYAGICALAVEILIGSGAGTSGVPRATSGVIGWPAGTWIVGCAGVVMIGVGLYQGHRAITADFLEDSKTEEMTPAVRTWFRWVGVFGSLARMVVFGMIGVFLLIAALDYDPRKAVGLDGSLATLAHASYGPFALGVVAAGLVAFAIYSFGDARFRRI
jgi:hypothetical protein